MCYTKAQCDLAWTERDVYDVGVAGLDLTPTKAKCSIVRMLYFLGEMLVVHVSTELAGTVQKHSINHDTSAGFDMELLFLQVIGILAVVMGHYYGIGNAINAFFPYYSWHMPFFIFLSGILFARKLHARSFVQTILIKIRRLLIPALFVNFCYGIISMVMRHYQLAAYGNDISLQTLFYVPFTSGYQFANNVSLWFIFQLFIIELLAACIYLPSQWQDSRFRYWDVLVLAISLLISLYSSYRGKLSSLTNLRLLLGRTGFLLFFFALGITYNNHIHDWIHRIKKPMLWCGIIVLIQAAAVILFKWDFHYDTRDMRFVRVPFFFMPQISAISATLFFILLGRHFFPMIRNSKFLLFVGSNIRYVVYHHQMCGILINCFALWIQSIGIQFLVEKFDVSIFQDRNWYKFQFGGSESLGYLPYLVVCFILPILMGKIINRNKNKYIRFALWLFILMLVILFLVLLGSSDQVQSLIRTATVQ